MQTRRGLDITLIRILTQKPPDDRVVEPRFGIVEPGFIVSFVTGETERIGAIAAGAARIAPGVVLVACLYRTGAVGEVDDTAERVEQIKLSGLGLVPQTQQAIRAVVVFGDGLMISVGLQQYALIVVDVIDDFIAGLLLRSETLMIVTVAAVGPDRLC